MAKKKQPINTTRRNVIKAGLKTGLAAYIAPTIQTFSFVSNAHAQPGGMMMGGGPGPGFPGGPFMMDEVSGFHMNMHNTMMMYGWPAMMM